MILIFLGKRRRGPLTKYRNMVGIIQLFRDTKYTSTFLYLESFFTDIVICFGALFAWWSVERWSCLLVVDQTRPVQEDVEGGAQLG